MATQLDEVLVVVEADAVVRPHAVVVHQLHALVAHATVMRSQWFDILAFGANCVLFFWKLTESILEYFNVIVSDLCISLEFTHVFGVCLDKVLIDRQVWIGYHLSFFDSLIQILAWNAWR